MTPNLFMGIDPNKTIVIVLNEKGFTLAKYFTVVLITTDKSGNLTSNS